MSYFSFSTTDGDAVVADVVFKGALAVSASAICGSQQGVQNWSYT